MSVETREEAPITPNADQAKALERIAQWAASGGEDFEAEADELALTGPAGTGKTSVLRLAKAALPSTTMYAAMTGKAASRMKEAAGIEATTLHRVLFEPPGEAKADKKGRVDLNFGATREPEGTALVVDESSMITPSIYKALQFWRSEYGVKVLYVGDSFQLPPVLSKEEEKELREKRTGLDYSVFGIAECVRLEKVMRNGDAILDAATMLRRNGRLPDKNRGGFALTRIPNVTEAAIAAYLADPDDHMLITWMNRTRMEANHRIRRQLGIMDIMPQPGEPILVCKNQFGGAVLNGEVYTIAEVNESLKLGPVQTINITTTCGKSIRAPAHPPADPTKGHMFDGTMPYIEDYSDWKRYRREIQEMRIGEPTPITYGHVLTAHKAQGSQARRVTVFLPRADTASKYFQTPTVLPGGGTAAFGTRFLYTALTRAVSQCELMMGL